MQKLYNPASRTLIYILHDFWHYTSPQMVHFTSEYENFWILCYTHNSQYDIYSNVCILHLPYNLTSFYCQIAPTKIIVSLISTKHLIQFKKKKKKFFRMFSRVFSSDTIVHVYCYPIVHTKIWFLTIIWILYKTSRSAISINLFFRNV